MLELIARPSLWPAARSHLQARAARCITFWAHFSGPEAGPKWAAFRQPVCGANINFNVQLWGAHLDCFEWPTLAQLQLRRARQNSPNLPTSGPSSGPNLARQPGGSARISSQWQSPVENRSAANTRAKIRTTKEHKEAQRKTSSVTQKGDTFASRRRSPLLRSRLFAISQPPAPQLIVSARPAAKPDGRGPKIASEAPRLRTVFGAPQPPRRRPKLHRLALGLAKGGPNCPGRDLSCISARRELQEALFGRRSGRPLAPRRTEKEPEINLSERPAGWETSLVDSYDHSANWTAGRACGAVTWWVSWLVGGAFNQAKWATTKMELWHAGQPNVGPGERNSKR